MIWVSDRGGEFARGNHLEPLHGDLVLGSPIWNFIHGAETCDLYHALFERVRTSGQPVSLLCHCDSPGLGRAMEIRIEPQPRGGVEVVVTIVGEESRQAIPRVDPGLPRGADLLSVCSWCRRVLTHPGRWLPIEHAIAELELFSRKVLPKLSHGACPDCYARVMAAEGLDPA